MPFPESDSTQRRRYNPPIEFRNKIAAINSQAFKSAADLKILEAHAKATELDVEWSAAWHLCNPLPPRKYRAFR